MSTVQEIEQAVKRLRPEELAAFREWFHNFDQELWDRQLEQDVAAGRLDKLAKEALADLRAESARTCEASSVPEILAVLSCAPSRRAGAG